MTLSQCRFNVAAGRSPRKCPRGNRPADLHHASMWPRAEAHRNLTPARPDLRSPRASMWPRAEAHGNLAVLAYVDHLNHRFNVAAGRSPRKWVPDPTRRALLRTLQCGRGPKPTEIAREGGVDRCDTCFNVAAGRSPRKSCYVGSKVAAHKVLQCGRGPKPTEILLRRL